MKGLAALTKRNLKEMVRNPFTSALCILLPLIMLVAMSIIFANLEFVPENFQISSYAAGICVFGYNFTSLYVALQIASDKSTSFIKRICIAPVKRTTYLLSYLLSGLLLSMIQTVLFFLIALAFGFPFNLNFLLSIIYLIPSAIFYIGLGILVGVICSNEKQTGPVSSVFISAVGILGGIFMPLNTFSGGFATFVNILPFSHSVLIASELQSVGAGCIYPHILILLGYIALTIALIALIDWLKARKR